MLKENNIRDRVLSFEEFARLLAQCPPHLNPIVKLAYHTAMRQGEILGLTWGQVDLKEGFIRLRPEDTKTNEAVLCPLKGNWWRCSARAAPATSAGIHLCGAF
jgi:integrase